MISKSFFFVLVSTIVSVTTTLAVVLYVVPEYGATNTQGEPNEQDSLTAFGMNATAIPDVVDATIPARRVGSSDGRGAYY